jgi:hypothetical protein
VCPGRSPVPSVTALCPKGLKELTVTMEGRVSGLNRLCEDVCGEGLERCDPPVVSVFHDVCCSDVSLQSIVAHNALLIAEVMLPRCGSWAVCFMARFQLLRLCRP